MYDAYTSIFSRCGLEFRAVEADTGKIGGSLSHEFMVLAETGEDRVVSCEACDYAANLEMAAVAAAGTPVSETAPSGVGDGPRKVETPGQRTVEEVTAFLGLKPVDLVKTIILSGEKGAVAVLVRGDHEVNPVKVRRILEDETVDLAEPEVVENLTGAPIGFAGPLGIDLPVYADNAVASMAGFVTGGNEKDVHMVDVDLSRFEVTAFADLREALEGDPCPRCGAGLSVLRGIGVGRTVAASIEQNHDDRGIVWPLPIAPFEVSLLCLDVTDPEVRTAADGIYNALCQEGVEVIYDDREERPGVKFNDADLTGIPIRGKWRYAVGPPARKTECRETVSSGWLRTASGMRGRYSEALPGNN